MRTIDAVARLRKEGKLPDSKHLFGVDSVRTLTKHVSDNRMLKVYLRYDDKLKNGHNTLSITGTYYENGVVCQFGMIHDIIAEHVPELQPFLKWHLVTADGPMHYLENTQYFIERGKLDEARNVALWPDATHDDLRDEQKLIDRLPALVRDFKIAVEILGFEF